MQPSGPCARPAPPRQWEVQTRTARFHRGARARCEGRLQFLRDYPSSKRRANQEHIVYRIIVNANYHWTQSRNSFLLLFSAAARAVPPSLHRNFSPPRPPARALNLLLSLAWNEVHSKLHDYPSRQYPQSRRASRAKTWDHECAKTWTTRARRRIEISDGVRACWVMQMCLPANTARRRGRRSSHGAPLMTHGR